MCLYCQGLLSETPHRTEMNTVRACSMIGKQEEAHAHTLPDFSGMHKYRDPGFPSPHLWLSEQHSSLLSLQDLLPSSPIAWKPKYPSHHVLSIVMGGGCVVMGGRCVVMITFQACHKLPREKTKESPPQANRNAGGVPQSLC